MVNFDPRQFLALADRLATSKDEAELRVSLGRAYYGIFLAWRGPVAAQLHKHAHDLSHSEFRDCISQRHRDPLAGHLVWSLWERRICADYRDTNPAQARQRSMRLTIDSSAATKSVQEAKLLDNLMTDFP